MSARMGRIGERGGATAEMAVLLPLLILFILLPFQWALWYDGRETLTLAAEEAADVVALENGDVATATAVARQVIEASGVVQGATISISGVGTDEVVVTITGSISWAILPFPRDIVSQASSSSEVFINPGERR